MMESGNNRGSLHSDGEGRKSPPSTELSVRRLIDSIFQTASPSDIHKAILQTVVDATRSDAGAIGYLDENGNMLCPVLIGDVWGLPTSTQSVVLFPPDTWSETWIWAVADRKALFTNESVACTYSEIPLRRSLVSPIIIRNKVVGIIQVANSKADYSINDQEVVEAVATHIASTVQANALLEWNSDAGGSLLGVNSAASRASLYEKLMTHGIRTQLQTVLSCTSVLRDSGSLEGREYLLDVADEAVRKCARVISKVEIMEQMSELPVRRRSLVAAVSKCVDWVSGQFENTQVEVRYHVEDAIVRADEFLEDLLKDILEAAIIQNPRPDKRVWVLLKEEAGGYEVSISDNGTGVSPDVKKGLLDRATQSFSLDLYQISHILRKYGGRLEVGDRVDGDWSQGTEVRIWMPGLTKGAQVITDALA